ncbi:hypothetical protein JVU11DRAFT_11380 [Chiua virens]|nr:hypothetical protein JVU11DRAFT_11380 [Chiua virens]
MSSLQVPVVQVLSRNEVTSVGPVKCWLMGQIKEGLGEMATARRPTIHCILPLQEQSETEAGRGSRGYGTSEGIPYHAVLAMQWPAQPSQHTPFIATMKDRYVRCLFENKTARQHDEIRRNNERLADQHDLLLAEVKEYDFRAVASGLGGGWLGMANNVAISG